MSRSSSPERPAFVAHQLCPPHLRRLVEDTVNSFDDKWLLPPVEGEAFDTAKGCLACLQAFAFSQGFAVVTTESRKGRSRFSCIHHGGDTKNWRKLEQHVEKDLESGKTVSKHQKEYTSKQTRGCFWEIYWSIRSVEKRDFEQVAEQLDISKTTHNHILTFNLIIYKIHQKTTLQYQIVVQFILRHRLAHQSYSAMRRVLESSDLSIDQKIYYNLMRIKSLKQSNDSFKNLMLALEKEDFKFSCLMSDELADNNSCKKRTLKQIFFFLLMLKSLI